MENALLIGLSKQVALERQLAVVANNLANLNTSGYRGEALQFSEYVMPEAEIGGITGPGSKVSYVIDGQTTRDFAEGEMNRTGNPLDLAIGGKGWFAVETAGGERYTRNGRFTLNENGELITTGGERVLGEGGAITFGADETDISISADGTISTNVGIKGRIRVVSFVDQQAMRKVGGNLFESDEVPGPAEKVRIAQGVLEGSNINAVKELTLMMEVTRAYVATAQLQERSAELKNKAISELGRLPNAA